MNTHLREVQHQTINGDIYDYYESIIDKITSSGEGSDTKFLSFDSSEPPCPIGPGQFTRLKLTDGSCNLTSFDSSFIILKIKTQVKFTATGNFNDFLTHYSEALDQIPVLYIGFKTGLHAIDHYRFYCDKGRGYICEQSQATYESAVTWFAKSQEEIEGSKGAYASYDDIMNCRTAVPGTYLTYKDIKEALGTNKEIPIEFEVTIKYDDFAPLQFFKIYPNSVCGNLQMEFKINNNKNFVACPIPLDKQCNYMKKYMPSMYAATAQRGAGSLLSTVTGGVDRNIAHKFVNMGDTFKFAVPTLADGTQFMNALYGDSQFNVSSPYLISARSYINGYNISQSNVDNLRMLFTNHKVYIPGQRIDQYSFSQTPSQTNMTCNTTQSLINCSSIAFIWPKSPFQLTCSENPMCSSIQLMIDNKTYPDKPFTTYDLIHSNYILNNLMFDDIFKPNHSLLYSIADDKVNNDYDDTNYMFVVSLERLDSDPFVFDGITKDNCFITLNGTFDTTKSKYSTSETKQPPIMLICQDTLWELSSEGVNYYYNDKNIIPSISNN